MAEPTPGRPGGAASGPRSATAATFVVNDSSLRDLRKTWQGLTDDVKNFGKALGDLKRHEGDLNRLQQKLAALGGAASPGGAAASSGRARNGGDSTFSGAGAEASAGGSSDQGRGRDTPAAPAGSGGRPRNGGDSTFSGGGGGGGGRGEERSRAAAIGRVVGGTAAGLATGGMAYYAARMGNSSDSDLLYNQLGRAQGGVYDQDRRRLESAAVMAAGGAQSQEDLRAGVTTVTQALGGTAATGRSRGALQEAGRLTSLNPDMGLAGAGQAVGSVYSATSINRLNTIGASPVAPGGATRNVTAVYDDILRQVFRGQPYTAQNITEGMVAGAPLQRSLDYLLPDPAAQQQFRAYALARANVGGDSKKANQAIQAAAKLNAGGKVSKAEQKLVDDAGLRDNIRSSQNRASQQSVENETRLTEAGRGGIMQGFEFLADATGTLTESFLKLNGALGGAPANGAGFGAAVSGPLQTALQAAGGIGGGLFAFTQVRDLLGGRGGRGGRGGGGGGSAGLGGDVQKVFVVNQCCDGVGGIGGSGGDGPGPDGPDGPDGGRSRGRIGRALRSKALWKGAGALVAGGLAWKGADMLSDKLEDRFGAGLDPETGERRRRDQLGKTAATIGKYAAGGAAAGAVIGGPVGALVGGAAGTLVGSAKSIYDWHFGSNQRDGGKEGDAVRAAARARREEEQRAGGEASRPQPYFSPFAASAGVPRMSKGGLVKGNHTRDDVDVKATPGEVIVPLAVVGRFGGAHKLMQMLGFSGNALGGRDSGAHYATGGEVIGDTEGIHPEFMRRLKAWSAAVGQPYKIGSGYRSLEEQQRLYDRWQRRVPGQAPAAKPGSSNHNFGLASDGPHWRGKNPGAFGLVYPMSYEPWHVEPVGAKGMRTGAVSPMDLAATSTTEPANGVGGSPQAVRSFGGASAASELEALAGILGGVSGGLGAAVKGVSSNRGAAAPEPGTATAATPPATPAPANPAGAVALGQQKAAARGWTGEEWNSLYSLWQKESGWNPNAANPTSSARGIPQAMMSAHFGRDWKTSAEAKSWMSDAGKQIDWGLNYIAGRYKTPSKAWAHSKKHNWYERGALDVLQDEVAQLHQGEMVVPKGPAAKLRSMIQQGRSMQGMQHAGGVSGVPMSKSVTLHIQAPVTVVGKATPDDARQFLEMVKAEAEQQQTLDFIGAG